jgi:hypothetical protein
MNSTGDVHNGVAHLSHLEADLVFDDSEPFYASNRVFDQHSDTAYGGTGQTHQIHEKWAVEPRRGDTVCSKRRFPFFSAFNF